MVDVPHPPSGGHTYRVTPSPSRSGQRPGLSQLAHPIVCAILADLHDEWQATNRRYLSEDSMSQLYPQRDTVATSGC